MVIVDEVAEFLNAEEDDDDFVHIVSKAEPDMALCGEYVPDGNWIAPDEEANLETCPTCEYLEEIEISMGI